VALPSDEVLSIWNQIMKYQVDFSFPLEFPVYLTLDSWLTADRVLDLGSGDGYYATRLATYFPDKVYTCVDIDERAIEAGKKQFQEGKGYKIEYALGDALDYRGKFSIAIARLLVQHLDAPQDLFRSAPNFLEPGGILMVIDSDDRSRLFWPNQEYPLIKSFFRAFNEFQPGRQFCSHMLEMAPQYGFEKEATHLLLIPSSIPGYKNVFYESNKLIFKIVQEHYDMEFDYNSLFAELDGWVANQYTYAHIGVNIIAFRRRV